MKSTNFGLLQGCGADHSDIRFAKGRTGVLFGAQTLTLLTDSLIVTRKGAEIGRKT